MTEISLLLC